jgi:hypothetical protein
MSLAMAFGLILAQLGGLAGAPVNGTELQKLAQSTLVQVEALRGQQLRKPLVTGVKTREEVMAFIVQRLADEYGPAKVKAEGRFLKLQGLLPQDLVYGDFIGKLLTEQVAGFYDHTRQELHIADWLPSLLQAPVMAHEIFHAIQDQEWGGGKLIDSKRYSHDVLLAHAALLEGDATVVMLNYQQKAMGMDVDVSTSPMIVRMIAASLPMQMSSPQFPVMASAPDYLKQSMIFPYQQGLMFVAALRQGGQSWDDVRQVYADPPASTEQILHPERYFKDRDQPSVVTISEPVIPSFVRTWEGVSGEFHARQLLLGPLSVSDATDAAAGWDGDYTVLETRGAEAYVLTCSTWDTAADAKVFAQALERAHVARKTRSKLMVVLAGTELNYAFASTRKLAAKALSAANLKARVKRR